MALRPQDILILVKLVAWDRGEWTYQELAEALGMGVGEVHRSLGRALDSRLVSADKKRPLRPALLEFLAHGVRYAFPAVRGGQTRGVPTCHAAPFMREVVTPSSEPPPVWPHPEGGTRGLSFSPLYKAAPSAALKDDALYRLLVLVDLLRGGNARERKWAESELSKSLRD